MQFKNQRYISLHNRLAEALEMKDHLVTKGVDTHSTCFLAVEGDLETAVRELSLGIRRDTPCDASRHVASLIDVQRTVVHHSRTDPSGPRTWTSILDDAFVECEAELSHRRR